MMNNQRGLKMDLSLGKFILQIVITVAFFQLAIVGIVQKDWNFGFAMNFTLGILYIILYFKPV